MAAFEASALLDFQGPRVQCVQIRVAFMGWGVEGDGKLTLGRLSLGSLLHAMTEQSVTLSQIVCGELS